MRHKSATYLSRQSTYIIFFSKSCTALLKFPSDRTRICQLFSHINPTQILICSGSGFSASSRRGRLAAHIRTTRLQHNVVTMNKTQTHQFSATDFKVQFHFQLCWICRSSGHTSHRDKDEGANKWLHHQLQY